MSYVMHLWEPPAGEALPADLDRAGALLDRLHGLTPGPNPKFRALARVLTARHPCLCSDEADDLPEDEIAWSDGPLDGSTAQAVWSIGLATEMLDEVRPFVVREANRLGLAASDEQAGQVFLPDGRVLGSAPAASAPAVAGEDELTGREVLTRVFERLSEELVPQGFKALKSEHAFVRRHPAGSCRILVCNLHRLGESTLSFVIELRFDAVTDLIYAIADPGRDSESVAIQFTGLVGPRAWLTPEPSLLTDRNWDYLLGRRADIDRVLAHLRPNLHARLLPLLKQCETIEGLDALMNPEPVSSSIFFTSYRAAAEHVITAHLAGNPRTARLCDEFEDGIKGYRPGNFLVDMSRRCIDHVRRQLAGKAG